MHDYACHAYIIQKYFRKDTLQWLQISSMMSVGAFEDSAKELDSKSLGWTSRNSEGIHNVTWNDKKDIQWHPALASSASSASKALFLETNCCCIKPTSPNLGEIHVEQSNMSKIMHRKSLHVYILYTLRTRGWSVQQLQHVGKVQILTGWIWRCLRGEAYSWQLGSGRVSEACTHHSRRQSWNQPWPKGPGPISSDPSNGLREKCWGLSCCKLWKSYEKHEKTWNSKFNQMEKRRTYFCHTEINLYSRISDSRNSVLRRLWLAASCGAWNFRKIKERTLKDTRKNT